jgi:hypothetical protein
MARRDCGTERMKDARPPSGRRGSIISAGSEIVGPATAASAGLLLGGPAGAVAGAAAVFPTTTAFRSLLGELARRTLGQREEMRAGAVLLAAQAEIQTQLETGRPLRGDGFSGSHNDRLDAAEIAEAAVLAAQRDPQQAKAPLLGKLLGRLQFEPRVDAAYAHQLIKETESLTYRQLCCLALFNLNVRDGYQLPDHEVLSGVTDPLDPRIGLLQEIVDLHRRTMLQQRATDHPGTDIILNVSTLTPARQELTGIGGWLSNLMDLSATIPAKQLQALADTLRALTPETTRVDASRWSGGAEL